ncbi:MAG: BatA domain-containing protein [Kiritimatiellia bacterium]
MISFLNFSFIFAFAALSIPLILHFIQSSRTQQLPFSTLRFLKLAQRRSSRRVQMENFLLMLLRFLLLALLVLGFMMPIVRTKKFGNVLSRTARDVAIVIDHSYSMNYKLNQQVVWDQAVELAVTVIEGLGDNDRYCVYLAGDQVTPVFGERMSDNKEEVATRLRSLPMPVGSSQLCPATIAALDLMEQDSRRGERELHIITDFQLLPWGSFKQGEGGTAAEDAAPDRPAGAGESGWDPAKVSDSVTCFVTLLGTAEPENSATLDVELAPKLITAETPCQVTVTLSRTGPPLDSVVSIFLDGAEVGRNSVMLGVDGANKVQFALPPMSGGVHALRVETPEDSLAEDNPFYFLIRVREKLPVLCVGDPESTFYLKAALAAGVGGVSPINAQAVQPGALSGENLAAYSCIFLSNAINLPGQQIKQLEGYVAVGGLLVIFPGSRALLADYALWATLPAESLSMIEHPVEQRKRLLTWDQPQHPILWNLVEDGLSPSLVIQRQLRCESLKDKAGSIVSTGSGEPFLVARPHGRGAVMLFTVAADRSWSDFPLSPFFLPMMHQLTQYAAGVGANKPYLWATDSLSLTEYLPEATRESVLKDPESKPISLRSAAGESGTIIHAEGLTKPGHYTLSVTGGGAATPALAINMPRVESDLTSLRSQDLPDILGIPALHVAEGKDDLLKKLDDFRIGRSLGETLLWLALLVAIAEVAYSNLLLRKNVKLTDTLKMEASGRLKGN